MNYTIIPHTAPNETKPVQTIEEKQQSKIIAEHKTVKTGTVDYENSSSS